MELNVLVIGMPNVGKSTLLNALRNMGIKGRTYLNLVPDFVEFYAFSRHPESLPDLCSTRIDTSTLHTAQSFPGPTCICL